MKSPSRTMWEQPWGYAEAFAIPVALFLGAAGFEFVTGKAAPTLSFPTNVVVLLVLINVIIILHAASAKNTIIRWFSSIPASIGALTFFLAVSLIMALVPQQEHPHSLFLFYNVTSSWLYYVATGYLLMVLGMVSVRRLFPVSKKNIGFFLNHLGLWITITAATFGAGDIEKYTMSVREGATEWRVMNANNTIQELDFAIQLKDFEIEEYPSKIGFVDMRTGDVLEKNRKKAIFELDTIHGIRFNEYVITIKTYYPTSMFYVQDYFPLSDIGATQSYYIEVSDTKRNKTYSDWIGAASMSQQAKYLILPDSIAIVALQPEAKKFSSRIRLYTKEGSTIDTIVEVNQPITCNSYTIYQTGYDENMGRWSETSIFELVRDPWLPIVYVGIFMMIAGALYIIWFGRTSKTKEQYVENI